MESTIGIQSRLPAHGVGADELAAMKGLAGTRPKHIEPGKDILTLIVGGMDKA
jgi:hypothetical protein